MKLTDLEPQFLKWIDDTHHQQVDSIAEADGIFFVCPKCFAENNHQRPGVHGVICWEPNVPQTTNPKPGRWEMIGTGLHDLSLRAGSSSILLTPPGCGAHFFITNGEVT
jgi:hypothetical protein